MDQVSALEQRIASQRKPGVTVACTSCGGRGQYPTASGIHGWVPPTQCARCAGTGEEPDGATRDLLMADRSEG